MRNAGYGQVFKDRAEYVFDRLDEKKNKDTYDFYLYGNELEKQINDLKMQISDQRKMVTGYARGASGAGQAGRKYLQSAIFDNNDGLADATERLQYLNEEYSRWQNKLDSYGDKLQSQIKALKTEIAGHQKMVTGYAGGASGAGKVGRAYQNIAIADNRAWLEEKQEQLGQLKSTLARWHNEQYTGKAEAEIRSFEKVKEAPDFDEYSLKGLGIENPEYDELYRSAKGTSIFGWQPFAPEIGNKAEFAANNKDEVKYGELDGNMFGAAAGIGNLAYMTEDERAVYAYWLAKEGEDKADKYLDALERTLNRRATEATNKNLKQISDKHKLAGTILNLEASLFTPAAYLDTAVQWIKNKVTGEYEPVDPYSLAHSASWITKSTQEGITQDIDSPFLKFLADTGLSAGQYLTKLPFGPAAALFVMSSGAAGMTATEAAARGATTDQALGLATIAGAAEYLTEKIPLNDLFKVFKAGKTTVKQALINIARQTGEEGLEEFVSEYVNTAADNLVMGDLSRMNAYINELVGRGISRKEAERQAKTQFFVFQPLIAAAGGALSGGGMASVGTAWSNTGVYLNNGETGKALPTALNISPPEALREKNDAVYPDKSRIEPVDGTPAPGIIRNGRMSTIASSINQSIPRTIKDGNNHYSQREADFALQLNYGHKTGAMQIADAQDAPTVTSKIDNVNTPSIRDMVLQLPTEDYKVPRINTPLSVFTDENGYALPTEKYPSAIRKYLNKVFKGKVLNIGADNKVYIGREGIGEFSFPPKRLDEDIKLAKFSAGVSLDVTLSPAVFLLNTRDDGRHPKATGGWDNFYVMFDTEKGRYSGIVKTMRTDRGRVFYDITEIKKEDETTATRGANEQRPMPAMQSPSSNNSITYDNANSNTAYIKGARKTPVKPGLAPYEASTGTPADSIPQNTIGSNRLELASDNLTVGAEDKFRLTLPGKELAEQSYEPSLHTPEQEKVIREYIDAVDPRLIDFAQQAIQNKVDNKDHFKLAPVSERQTTDIRSITGINTLGYETILQPSAVRHIFNRHGPSGKHDTSMSNPSTLARIQYVISNYDVIVDGGRTTAYSNREGKQARTVRYKKKIDGTYYVVEAVLDNEIKKVYIVTAYLSNKVGVSRPPDVKNPLVTSENASASTPNINVAQNGNNINSPASAFSGESENDGRLTLPGFEDDSTSANADPIAQTSSALKSDKRNSITGKNKRLTVTDLIEYLSTGKPGHTRSKKNRLLKNGISPILTSPSSIRSFIQDAIFGRAPGEIRAYGMVGDHFSQAVKEVNSNTDISGYYLELDSDSLRHSYLEHHEAKQGGNIPLSHTDFENMPDYIDNYDYILSVENYNGKKKIRIAKKINGYCVIISTISGERKSLHILGIVGMETARFESKYMNRIRSAGSQGVRPDKPTNQTVNTTALHTDSTSDPVSNIPHNGNNINSLKAPLSDYTENDGRLSLPGFDDDSTVINTDPSIHTKSERDVIDEYIGAVDEKLVSFIYKVKGLINNEYRNKIRYPISDVTGKTALAVWDLVGIDPSGYKNILTGSAIDHIEKRHGANGKADHSMSNAEDLARIRYIIENHDHAKLLLNSDGTPSVSDVWKNSDGTPAQRIVLSKKINGTYYTVEAAPDSKAKVLAVESAFISNEGGSTGTVLNIPQSGPQVTSDTPQRADTSSNATVAQPDAKINSLDAAFDGEAENDGRLTLPGFDDDNTVRTGKKEQKKAEGDLRPPDAYASWFTADTDSATTPSKDKIAFASDSVKPEDISYSLNKEGVSRPPDVQAPRITSENASAITPDINVAQNGFNINSLVSAFGGEDENDGRLTLPGFDDDSGGGKASGFVKNRYSKDIGGDEANLIDILSRAAGVRTVIVAPTGKNGANGWYENGVVSIARDAENKYSVVAKHEITHRLQETAPEAYLAFRGYAVNALAGRSGEIASYVEAIKAKYLKAGIRLGTEEAMDEIAADFTERLLIDAETIRRFVNDDRSTAQKFFDALMDFLLRVKRAFEGEKSALNAAAREAYGLTKDQLEMAAELWTAALKEAGQTSVNENRTDTRPKRRGVSYEGDVVKIDGAPFSDLVTGTAQGGQYGISDRFALKLPGGEEETASAYPEDRRALYSDSQLYSYEFLTNQPDMAVTKLPDMNDILDNIGEVDRRLVEYEGLGNAEQEGFIRRGSLYVINDYTDGELRIDKDTTTHSVDGDWRRIKTNGRLGAVAGALSKHAIPINGLLNENSQAQGTYAMAAYATDEKGRDYIAIITVEQLTDKVSDIGFVDAVHALSGRIKRGNPRLAQSHPVTAEADPGASEISPIRIADSLDSVNQTQRGILSRDEYTASGRIERGNPRLAQSHAVTAEADPDSSEISHMSISDFLDIVNQTHQGILSRDVLEHFKAERDKNGYWGSRALFSMKDREDKFALRLPGGQETAAVHPEDTGGVSSVKSKQIEPAAFALQGRNKGSAAPLTGSKIKLSELLDNVKDAYNLYPVRSNIQHAEDNIAPTAEIEILDVLEGSKSKRVKADTAHKLRLPSGNLRHLTESASKIKISELLDIVKDAYPDTLSQDVLYHFGISRPGTELGGYARYSLKDKRNDDYAPVFYSRMERAVEDYKGSKIAAAGLEQFLKSRGVKNDEIRWSGILAFSEGRKSVSKDELLDFIRANGLKIREITKEDRLYYSNERLEKHRDIKALHNDNLDMAARIWPNIFGEKMPETILSNGHAANAIAREMNLLLLEYGSDREWFNASVDFDNWELLKDLVHKLGFEEQQMKQLEQPVNDARYYKHALPGGINYREILFTLPDIEGPDSLHWEEENVIAHVRLQDFTDTDVSLVLFVDEIQSDWHEQGREKGYSPVANKATKDKARLRFLEDYLDRTAQEEAERTASSLEDTKFNLLMEDEEYIKAYEEREALAERLREYSDIDLEGVPGAPFKTTWHELVLKRVLRLAAEGGYDKIAWATGQMQKERYNLSDATGMRDFYDVGGASSQNIPRFLSRYVRQWSAEVESVHIVPYVPDGFWNLSYIVPGVEISEAMRRSVLFDGQPRFSLKNGGGELELPGAELVSSEYGEAGRMLPNDASADIIISGDTTEGAGETFTQGSTIPDELLNAKPSHSPAVNKWLNGAGKIEINNGTWKYTNPQGVSVTYKNGYPDFKGSGHVVQEANIGGFTDYYRDFKNADMITGGRMDPINNVWHHLEDGRTLQEVNKQIHMQFTHRGGMSAIKR